ncbi:MAG: hypothetical protein KAY21_10575 [Limnohabitans sp.]|nr:hypothetical protein [Limnohabitans sp.]
MIKRQKSQPKRRHRSGSRRKAGKMDAASFIHFFRKHGTLTLVLSMVVVSVAAAFVAIELGA